MVKREPPRYLASAGVWLIGSVIAWGLGYGLLRSPVIDDPGRLAPVAASFAALGLIVGLALAASASIAFHRILKIRVPWFIPTAIGVPLGLGIGFLTNGQFLLWQVRKMGMQLVSEGGGAQISPPGVITLALAGVILACIQLPFLARVLTPSLQTKALWILGSFAAYGGGWSASAILVGAARPSPLHGAFMGAISGITILLLVLVLEAEWRRPTTR